MSEKHTFLRALKGEAVEHTPIWLMRQAGRYLPEYRAVRSQAGSFMNLCTNPELACQVTLQPLERFPLDAAILFSDILTIPDAMGLGLRFAEGEGPVFDKPLRSAAAIDRLGVPDPEAELRYVVDAVRLIRRELNERVPLIGFSGSPWTLSTYAIEGGASKTFRYAKALLYQDPSSAHKLLGVLTESVVLYLSAQIEAGAQAIMVFDTWGGVLTSAAYEEFSLAYMQEIVSALASRHPEIPVILFTKGAGVWLSKIAATGCRGIGCDWTIDLDTARRQVGTNIALQGNLDPSILFGSSDAIVRETARVLQQHGSRKGHIFNLGHGIQPETPIEAVALLVEAVHQQSRALPT